MSRAAACAREAERWADHAPEPGSPAKSSRTGAPHGGGFPLHTPAAERPVLSAPAFAALLPGRVPALPSPSVPPSSVPCSTSSTELSLLSAPPDGRVGEPAGSDVAGATPPSCGAASSCTRTATSGRLHTSAMPSPLLRFMNWPADESDAGQNWAVVDPFATRSGAKKRRARGAHLTKADAPCPQL
jgi:hypothetical protein